ncbi:etoposide-induced protein 2.4-domain-containing protein [Melampsora americana]|nr:etoposide-induced protein 2.4-domain-containing protein [Melampsora americana]
MSFEPDHHQHPISRSNHKLISNLSPSELYPSSKFRSSNTISNTYLTLTESIRLHLGFVKQGISDARQWKTILDVLSTNKQLRSNLIQNVTLQAVLLTSFISFELFPRIIHADISHLRFYFDILWLYPISLLSTLLNGFLSVRVSKALFNTSSHSRRLSKFLTSPNVETYKGLTHSIISESYRALVLLNYFAFSHLLARVPYIGTILSFAYCTIANSYYCFERSWSEGGQTFAERVKNIEERWTYHAGFGFLITMLSFWHSNLLVNLSLFTLFFPFLLILASASTTHPLPWSPSYPLALNADPHDRTPQSQFKISPAFPVRIPIFTLSVKIHEIVVRILRPSSNQQSRNNKHSTAFRLDEMEGGASPDLSNETFNGTSWPGQSIPFDGALSHRHPNILAHSNYPTSNLKNTSTPGLENFHPTSKIESGGTHGSLISINSGLSHNLKKSKED